MRHPCAGARLQVRRHGANSGSGSFSWEAGGAIRPARLSCACAGLRGYAATGSPQVLERLTSMEQMTAMRALNVEPTSVDRPPDRDAQTSSRSSSPLRVFVGGLAHETNTFSPL